jgi:hypothetical protein
MRKQIPYALKIRKGATYTFSFKYLDAQRQPYTNFVNWGAKLKIRPIVDSPVVLVNLSKGSGITLQADGTVTIIIASVVSGSILQDSGVYDIVLTDLSSNDKVPLSGPTIFEKLVSRD